MTGAPATTGAPTTTGAPVVATRTAAIPTSPRLDLSRTLASTGLPTGVPATGLPKGVPATALGLVGGAALLQRRRTT